jgi:hypothetical protein
LLRRELCSKKKEPHWGAQYQGICINRGRERFKGVPINKNLLLFLCLLIRNLMPFWTNIILLKPNLKSKFINFFFPKNRVFLGAPAKSSQPRFMLTQYQAILSLSATLYIYICISKTVTIPKTVRVLETITISKSVIILKKVTIRKSVILVKTVTIPKSDIFYSRPTFEHLNCTNFVDGIGFGYSDGFGCTSLRWEPRCRCVFCETPPEQEHACLAPTPAPFRDL